MDKLLSGLLFGDSLFNLLHRSIFNNEAQLKFQEVQ